ncbi:aspartate carbamoyltransferase [Pyrolobus fumarii 1A]|uniref:Aspartate carbamoyltransferase n=1 Tax=Pyrolobus fumarii (strain DSM 11204 / 1A) TaxID=694429 RepID=G0EHM2_PYRF1|nr:aspartate carbamoyltransferase [Pyrolobus fumarii]AEM39375.1 aspartate carbamoyltransferase [Pyrolobus fumarii 1A]
MGTFKGRDVISILDFNREELEMLFEEADRFERMLHEGHVPRLLEGRILALAFFEPSTRTRLSFEAAMKRLGGETIGFTSEEAISVAKGESFADTIRMLDAYADAIVVRHKFEGAALYAAEVAEHPVINAGDGKQHHPTQAMLDLYTVRKLFGSPDGLVYGVLGDLRYSRAAISFLYGLTLFKPRMVYLISPPQLRVREEVREVLRERGLKMQEVERLEDVIQELDVLYVVRIQRERFPDPMEYERVRGSYRVTPDIVSKGKDTLRVLHPLPKVDEIDPRVDTMPQAAYFYQARLGVPLRMALLYLILGGEKA